MRAIAMADGGCRKDGESVCGVVIYHSHTGLLEDLKEITTLSIALGSGTNNTAEYCGAIAALAKALELGVTDIRLIMDSQLVVKQIKGEYNVTNKNLKKYYYKVIELKNKFHGFSIEHVYREQNTRADELANLAYTPKEKK